MSEPRNAVAPGRLELGPTPADLPDPSVQPPSVAESADPFTSLRVLHLVARLERGRPALITDLADRLNAEYLDWLFSPAVVGDVVVQLQSNWLADYRNASGVVVEDGPYGPTLTIEDSSRVDPWIVRQVQRQAAAARERLAEFSRRDRASDG